VLLNKKGIFKERFVLKIVPNMEKRREGYGQTIKRFRMSYGGPE
jgi:hypothetical protein